TATNLAVHGATGFGASTVVTSAVANFAANVGPAGVHLDNTGPLAITTVDGGTGVTSGGGGGRRRPPPPPPGPRGQRPRGERHPGSAGHGRAGRQPDRRAGRHRPGQLRQHLP